MWSRSSVAATGDQTRGWAPPYVNGESAYFMSTNRNKRSITLDVKTPEGGEIIRRLVDGADIFINNLPRLSSMQELALDPESCLVRNPRLIHVAISGFGHTGPRAGQPGYDILAQGMSGIMSLTGEPDGAPIRYPVPISDMSVGVYALIAILAALYERERTGRGQAIDAGILEAQMTWLCPTAGSYFATGRTGSAWATSIRPSRPTSPLRPPTATSSSRAAPIASGDGCAACSACRTRCATIRSSPPTRSAIATGPKSWRW